MKERIPPRIARNKIHTIVDHLTESPKGNFGKGMGLARATRTAALIEVAYHAYFGGCVSHDAGSNAFLRPEQLEMIAYRLQHAQLQPQESRYRNILDWSGTDKPALRQEMRDNMLRFVPRVPLPYGNDGLMLHMLFDLRMRYNADGYLSAFEPEDFVRYEVLYRIRDDCLALVPEFQPHAA